MNPKNLLFFGSFALGIALDQASKWWVFHHIAVNHQEIPILPGFFSLVHSENPGAVFGSLGDAGEWRVLLFLAFTVVAVGIIGNLWWQLPKRAALLPALYGFILSGAVGNAVDRVIKGEVTDFLLVYLGGWPWPAFNMADVFLSVGVTLFVLWELFFDRDEQADASSPAPG